MCLVDEYFIYRALRFYGTPRVTDIQRWAFNTNNPQSISESVSYDCDVLLTYHALDYEKL